MFSQRYFANYKTGGYKYMKTSRNQIKKTEACTFQAYREVYYIDIKEDYVYMLYPVRQNLSDKTSFSSAVDKHFLVGKILKNDENKVRDFLDLSRIKENLKDDNIIECKYQRLHKNGIGEWCLVSIIAQRRNEQEVESAIITIRSIDDVVRNEEKQNRKLEKVIEKSLKANQAKTVFLSSMSHDMRTPLNAIIGFSNMAQKNISDTAKVKMCLDKILQSGEHLLNLINDILDMSRIESGKNQINLRKCNIYERVYSVTEFIQAQTKAKNLNLSIQFENVINAMIYADDLKLNKVFINILSNAVKYTESGGTITYRIKERESDKKGYTIITFVIEDTGIGISEEFIEHIFEPFERERSSTQSGILGTGIGMTISKTLVDMMGGRIWAESQVGKGSKFYVEMEFKLFDIRETALDENIKTSVSNNLKGKKVLLVEDNELNMEIAEDMLKEAGIEVVCAKDGVEAVGIMERCNDYEYDGILMDVQMPVMNGYEATKRIRKLDRADLKVIPIIAMTANAFAEDRKIAKKNGMTDHISKPVDSVKLLKTLEKAFI